MEATSAASSLGTSHALSTGMTPEALKARTKKFAVDVIAFAKSGFHQQVERWHRGSRRVGAMARDPYRIRNLCACDYEPVVERSRRTHPHSRSLARNGAQEAAKSQER